MKHCAAPACPFIIRYGRAAEYGDAIHACVDCGGALSDGPAPDPPPPEVAPAPRASRALWLRGAITFAVAGLALALYYLPLPTREGLGFDVPSGGQAGLLAVGLGPLVVAFGFTELVSALVPRLRPMRYAGPRGRARLVTMSLALGLALTLVTTTLTVPPLTYALALDQRLLSLLLVAAPVALYAASRVVDRFGVGGGLPLLVATLVVPDVVRHLIPISDGAIPTSAVSEAALLLAIAVLVVPIWWTCRPTSERPRWLRHVLPAGALTLPLSGGSPLGDLLLPLTALTPLIFFLGWWIDLPPFLYPLPPISAHLAALGGAALVVGWLYNQPRRVAAVHRALRRSDHAVEVVAALRRTLWRALPLSVVVLVAAAWLWSWGADGTAGTAPRLIEAATLAVVGLDLASEWRARRALGPLTRAWCLHRTYAVGPVLLALEGEGIAAFARSRHLRALFPFLASWAPIDLMVRPADAERARAFLAARLGASGRLSRDAILDALS